MRGSALLWAGLCLLLMGCSASALREPEKASLPPDPFAKVDAYALSAPEGASESPEALAAYLCAPGWGEAEKARAIFRWMAGNIDYDLDAALHGDLAGGSEEAFRQRRAVCGGFSDLYSRLAALCGLEAVRVAGWARGMGYSVGDPVRGAPNHAWNAVRVEGRWLLLDCTWAAGAVDETGAYRRRFDPWYFDPEPEKLLFTHYPEDASWQLVSTPVGREEFSTRPYLRSTFFARGLTLISPESCFLPSEGGRAAVVVEKPPGAFLIVRLMAGGAQLPEERVRLSEKGEAARVEVDAEGLDGALLRLFAGDASTTEGRTRRYEWAADFRIVPSGEGTPKGSPGEPPPTPD